MKQSTDLEPSYPPHNAITPSEFIKTKNYLLLSRHRAKPDRAFGKRQSVGILFIILTLNSTISSVGTPYSSLPPITASESSKIGTIYAFVL